MQVQISFKMQFVPASINIMWNHLHNMFCLNHLLVKGVGYDDISFLPKIKIEPPIAANTNPVHGDQ